jgi:prepilin-type N-terminal cleavage/methylation domain-containing protein
MRRNGFTLAEVLITLTIIGVVATLTLPALLTNTAEQQAKTALKKGINTLTEAAQMTQALDGYDYASLVSDDTSKEDEQSLFGLLQRRASIDRTKGTKLESHQGSKSDSGSSNFAVFFRDGSALMYLPSETTSANRVALAEDGLPNGIRAIFDINGTKGPNIVSNCQGTVLGNVSDNTNSDASKACTSKNRVIKDQFGVRLRGGIAVPNGAAARWAFEN